MIQDPHDEAGNRGGNPFAFVLLVLVLITLYITGRMLFSGVNQLMYSSWLHTWPTTAGTLVDSSIEEQVSARNGRKFYTPRIKYVYKDATGQTFQGDRFTPDGNRHLFMTENQVAKQLQELRRQNSLTVHYNPNKHDDAALDVNVDDGFLNVVWGLGLMLLIVPTIAGSLISSELDRMFAWRSEKGRVDRLPPSWRRFGIYDDVNAVRFVLTRKRWLSTFAAVGLALVLSGVPALLTSDGVVPGGPWQWALAMVAVAIALYFRLGRATFRSYLFDARKGEIYECKRGGDKQLFALFSEMSAVELLDNPTPRGETRGRTRLELPVHSGEGSTYRLTLDLSTLPEPVVTGLAQRLANLTGKELLRPEPAPPVPVVATAEEP